MYLQFYEVGTEDVAAHLCGEHGLSGIAHTGGVGKQLHVVAVDVCQHVVGGLVHHVYALHGHGNHLRLRRYDGVEHKLWGGELTGPHEEARGELASSYYKILFHISGSV